MANKRYDQFGAGTPISTNITLFADPATGALSKCALSSIIALQPSNPDLLYWLSQNGGKVLATVCGLPFFSLVTTDSLVNSQERFFPIALPALTITGVYFMMQTFGVFTANNFNGFSLYKPNGSNLDLVAQTANDGNMFKTGWSGGSTVPFTSSYNATPGLYMLSYLFNSSSISTTPRMYAGAIAPVTAQTTANNSTGNLFIGYKINTGTPATIAWNTLSALFPNLLCFGVY